MKIRVVVGILLIVVSLIMFVYDMSRVEMLFLQLLGTLNIISPFLSGKKLAGYLHDSSISHRRGFKASPTALVYVWLFIWFVVMLTYMVFSMIFSYAIKYIISSFNANYMGIVYTIIMLIGSYLIFRSRYDEKDDFVTSWGKALERSKKAGASGTKKLVDKAKSFEKYL